MYIFIFKFSCELLFVLFMQHILKNILLYKEIEFLASKNFKNRKNDVMMALAYANVDYEMSDPKTLEEDAKKFQEWKNSNRVCLMTLK